jgi:transposase
MALHIESNSMASPDHYSSKLLNHLGLVSVMFDELGIGNTIDCLIPQDQEKRNVSVGQAIKAMVLNGLGFSKRALYLTPQFFQDKPVEMLIGKGVEAEHLNDDILGRALDKIYTYGPDLLYPQLALPAVKHLGLLCRFGHLDSTSFHVDGQYKRGQNETGEGVIHITQGYSRDHRPDLNQVVLQLICERQAGIPLLMESLSGNNSDKDSFRDMVTTHIAQLRSNFNIEYLIADSAFYVAETLKEMNDFPWVSRVPETLAIARDMIHSFAPDLMADREQTSYRSLGVVYGDVKQRWVIIFSPEACQRAHSTVNKRCLKQSQAEYKDFKKLCKLDFACEADATKALNTFQKKQKITIITNAQIVAFSRYKSKGRPVEGQAPDFYVYRIEGGIASVPYERTRRLERKSCFILATNQLDLQALSDDELIFAYKDQQKVERGFRFLKDPMFMASTLFLKSPKRIMALMMVMTLCLLIYAALEYRIRESLRKNNKTFPNQKGIPIANPTSRWIFEFFSGIHVLIIAQVQVLTLNLNEHHIILLRLLGKQYEALYTGHG